MEEFVFKAAKMINDGTSCEHSFLIEQRVLAQVRPHRICSKCGLTKETEQGYMNYPAGEKQL